MKKRIRNLFLITGLLITAACFCCCGEDDQNRAEEMGLGNANVVDQTRDYTVYELTFQRENMNIYG